MTGMGGPARDFYLLLLLTLPSHSTLHDEKVKANVKSRNGREAAFFRKVLDMNEQHNEKPDESQGPKYFVNIEGSEYPWATDTITTEQIAELGGWDASKGVLEIDRDNNERTLKPGEVVTLKPGQGFAKKIRWKRG